MKLQNCVLTLSALCLLSCTSKVVSEYGELPPISDRNPASADISASINVNSPSQIFGANPELGNVDWRNLFYELNYWNMKQMTQNSTEFNNLLYNSVYYSEKGFNNAYWKLIYSQTSDRAYRNREKMMAWRDDWHQKFAPAINLNKAGDLNPATQDLVTTIKNSFFTDQKLNANNNYFKTAVGQKIMSILKDYVIVVVPGFASHTIPDYTWPEIVRQANAYYGRNENRTACTDKTRGHCQDFVPYYTASQGPVAFDVVHPLGDELGYSMGSNADSADSLAQWIVKLRNIPAYSNKKIVLIGYSKGTPISMNTVVNHPEVGVNIAAIFTMAGVNQGAISANSAMSEIYQKTNARSLEELKIALSNEKIATEQKYTKMYNYVTGQINSLGAGSTNVLAKLSDMLGAYNLKPECGFSIDCLPGNETVTVADQGKLIDGISDMSNFESVKWNLLHFNDNSFKSKITIFNFSMLANVKDFVMPNASQVATKLTPPSLIPQLKDDGSIDYSMYSRDNVFMYATSLSGFEDAPAGLFDTQVAWLDTKAMALDTRPLMHSLDPTQWGMLRDQLSKVGYSLPDDFQTLPRNRLLLNANNSMHNINFVDVGEARGTHWDTAFEEVYHPDPAQVPNYYRHPFPRRALQVSLIEMLAVYKTLGGL